MRSPAGSWLRNQASKKNVLPPGHEHEPTAYQQAASDGIADGAIVLLGTGEGQAEAAGTDPPSHLHCQTGASLPMMTAPRVVATCDISLICAAAIIELAQTGAAQIRVLWRVARHCLLTCLSRRPAGKRLDQLGKHLGRVPLVIDPLRRLRAARAGQPG
jgi:hypothetical protein